MNSNSKSILLTDDTSIPTKSNRDTLEETANNTFNTILNWYTLNDLTLKCNKTHTNGALLFNKFYSKSNN